MRLGNAQGPPPRGGLPSVPLYIYGIYVCARKKIKKLEKAMAQQGEKKRGPRRRIDTGKGVRDANETETTQQRSICLQSPRIQSHRPSAIASASPNRPGCRSISSPSFSPLPLETETQGNSAIPNFRFSLFAYGSEFRNCVFSVLPSSHVSSCVTL